MECHKGFEFWTLLDRLEGKSLNDLRFGFGMQIFPGVLRYPCYVYKREIDVVFLHNEKDWLLQVTWRFSFGTITAKWMRFWFVVMVEPCQDVLGIGWIRIFTTVNCTFFSSVNTTGKWKPPKDMTWKLPDKFWKIHVEVINTNVCFENSSMLCLLGEE